MIDVVMLPPQAAGGQPFSSGIAVVLDILRATSTMVTALGNQAGQIIPVAEPAAAFALKQKIGAGACILGGERRGFKIAGFDLGNSPAEYKRDNIRGKTIILCTSNGTKAVLGAENAREVLIGSFLNMSTICDYLRTAAHKGLKDIYIVCSGREGKFSLEDFTGAGMIVDAIGAGHQLSDTAKAAQYIYEKARIPGLASFVGQTEHGRYLREIGMDSDIVLCTELNKYPILPRMTDGIIKLGSPPDNPPIS